MVEAVLFDYGGVLTDVGRDDSTGHVYEPRESIYKIAESLREQGVVTGILSDIDELVAEQLREAGFDPLILFQDAEPREPATEIYKKALSSLGMRAGSVVYVDDEPKKLEPARSLGMFTVHAHSEQQLAIALPAFFRLHNEASSEDTS